MLPGKSVITLKLIHFLLNNQLANLALKSLSSPCQSQEAIFTDAIKIIITPIPPHIVHI